VEHSQNQSIGYVVGRIVDSHQPYYSKELIGLIPNDILQMGLANGNPREASVKIDDLRVRKEKDLLKWLGIQTSGPKLSEAEIQELVDSVRAREERGEFPPEQQQRVREINFLFNVATIVARQ